MLLERRIMLLKMHKFGGNWNHMKLEDELCYDPNQVDSNELWKSLGYGDMEDENQIQRKGFSKYFRSGIKHILRRSSSSSTSKTSSSSRSSGIKRLNLQSFLSSGDFVGLSVKASQTKLSFYRGWPNIHVSRFISCKSLCSLVDSERIWIVQCEVVKVLPLPEIVQWRIGISSYKALCRFLAEVMKPLVGVWVHQNQIHGTQRKGFSKYFKSGIKHILGRSSSSSTSKSSSSSSSGINRLNLQSFLSSGDFVGLSVKASKTKLSSYRGWPNMHETRLALYKLPIKNPVNSQEYAGLWGGTFGWPPGKCTEEKPGK